MIHANSNRQPAGRLERYMQIRTVSRWAWYTLFKNRKQNIFCYDIYGCTINRMYKKTYNMYISVFPWGSRWARNYFRMWKQKPLRVIAGKLTVRNAVNRGIVHSSKKKFRDALLDLVGINLRICGISIDPGHRRRCFRRRQRAVWAISGSRHQPRSRRRSVSCDRVNVNKPKLRNFDQPLGLPGHLQWSFRRRQRVISSKYDGTGAWQLPLPSAAEQQSRSQT